MEIRLADSEVDVMRILWCEGRPLKISEFRDGTEPNSVNLTQKTRFGLA